MTDDDEPYPCVGICSPDPDSGYCLGCGRPPLESPEIVAEVPAPVVNTRNIHDDRITDPDSPE